MLKDLVHKKRCNSELKRFKVLDDYYFTVNSSIFFTENVLSRIDQLYSTFQEYPLISAKCGHEILGEVFNEEYEEVPDKIYKETFYKCEYNDIQISTFIEHHARLAILKNAIDYILYKANDIMGRACDTRTVKLGKRKLNMPILDFLPSSFRQGLEEVAKDKYFYLYSVFWQWFMWVFGGFILKDKKEEEYKILSEKTGIPVEEIPNAFRSYELLFPRPEGWLLDLPSDSNIKIMHMFPVPFMGIGANYRRLIYTENKKFEELKLSGQFTLTDLIKWNNLVVNVLKKYISYN